MRNTRLLAVLCVFYFSLFCFKAHAATSFLQSIHTFVFFGDSLTDNGNLYQLFKIPKSPPYHEGRFSNGSVWAETLGAAYFASHQIQMQNYAVGGATVILRNPFEGAVPWTFSAEISEYFKHSKQEDRAGTLFIVWLGANDYLDEVNQDVDSLTKEVIAETLFQFKRLIQQGARHFLVLNIPDLSRTPYSKGEGIDSERLRQLSLLHYQKLNDAIAILISEFPEVHFLTTDVYALFNDIIINTEKYNQLYHQHFSNTGNACWDGGYTLHASFVPKQDLLPQWMLTSPSIQIAYQAGLAYERGLNPCDQPDDYIFWDQVHPTAPVHTILASIIKDDLDHAV